jgi:D-3-phosphoglycerate dehydrogenase
MRADAAEHRYQVVVLDHPFDDLDVERRILGEIGAEVVDAHVRSEDEAIDAGRHAEGVLVRRFPVTARVVDAMERCAIICNYGTGYENVDVAAAQRRGIAVANTVGYADEEVADHALAMILALARKLLPLRAALAADASAGGSIGWSHAPHVPIRRLRDQTLGIVGFGRIGRTLARKALAVGMRVIAADPFLAPGAVNELDITIVPLGALLVEADFVSLHIPLSDDTHHLIGEPELAAMKPAAYVINCARGPVVDTAALVQALEAGRLAGAGLDVTDPEPPPPDTLRLLLTLPNVIVTPHVAWYSEESLADRRRIAAETVRQALIGRT